jgi:hypothetical protein
MLAIQIRNKHGTIVRITPRLIVGKHRRLATLRRDVSEAFAETTLAKLLGTAKELN